MEYILIADDNKDITDILEKYVKKEGYGALIATDGIQTEELFHTYHPAAILLDVMMPHDPTGIRRTDHFNYGTRRRL